jgi:hypothetical protein
MKAHWGVEVQLHAFFDLGTYLLHGAGYLDNLKETTENCQDIQDPNQVLPEYKFTMLPLHKLLDLLLLLTVRN